jgi:cytochrome P450
MPFTDSLPTLVQKHLPFFLGILRTFKPIVTIKGYTAVTRFTDVQEVLSRPDVFGVTYAKKMGVVTDGGNFFLGMDNTPTYTRDVSNMRILIRREDIETVIAPMITRLAAAEVARHSGSLDVVQDISGAVPARFVKEYMGIPGPSENDMIEWTTYLFQYLFFPNNPKDVDTKAAVYAKALREYLGGLLAVRKMETGAADDTIARSFALQRSGTLGMSDLDIRNNLIGIVIGAIPTTSRCVALVIDYLLDHPGLLASAQSAACNNDIALLRQYVLECLRFNSFGAGSFRIAKEDYVLASGTLRSTKIKKGDQVIALTQSAMLDGRQLDCPGDFKLDRPLHHYMHFGYGMHTCFGYYINLVQIPIIVAAILKRPHLRRIKNTAMQYRGPFPISLPVEFDA